MYKVYYRELEKVETLPNNVMEYLKDYKNQERYNQSINAWKLLSEKLKSDFNINLENCEIKKTNNGKPFIDGIYFNISHSKDLVSVIISDTECGIDIQYVNSKINHRLMAKKVLSCEEYDIYIKSDDKIGYFISQWTKKEAYLKCYNDGITGFGDLRDNYNVYTEKLVDKQNNEYYLSFVIKEDVCTR